MIVTAKLRDGTQMLWSFPCANNINKLVSALAENVDDWVEIEVKITALGPDLLPD